ncbi:MAG: DUF3047 domain-containing protein [Desulfuromonadales bacterium]|jgi:hypothetical protein
MRFAVACLLLGLVTWPVRAENEALPLSRFAEAGLAGWTVKKFAGTTAYRLVEVDGQTVLQAHSQAAASGLVHEIAYDPQHYPILAWRWKINGIIPGGDGRSKAGDDYAARVYVVFPHWFFLKTRSLNYIWANVLPQGTVQPNAYTGNAMMIAVNSGAEKAGQWVSVERNIVEDYRRAFGEDPPQVGAIAVMTDTDNTGQEATAWYADLEARRQ